MQVSPYCQANVSPLWPNAIPCVRCQLCPEHSTFPVEGLRGGPHPRATLHPCLVHPGSGGLMRFQGLEQQKSPWRCLSASQQAFPSGSNPRWKSRQHSSRYRGFFFAIICFGSKSISVADTAGQYSAKGGIRDCLSEEKLGKKKS